MKTSSKNLDKCQVKITVTLEAAEMTEIVKNVEKTFMREAQVPGFRKGKVPLEIIRKDFADQLAQEKQRVMVQKHYGEALKAEKIESLALAGFEDVKIEDAGGAFTAVVEVKPTFKLPTYKGLKIAAKDVSVKDAQVEEHISRLRTGYAKYEDGKDGDAVQAGDFAQIDYEGSVGKKKILEINPEAKVVGEGKGFWFLVEDGRFLPEIVEAVQGMKAGETKDGVKAKFDKESAPEGLKGEKAVYSIKLTALRRRILPTDAELVEKMKAESFEKLTAQVRESLEKAATEAEVARRENEAVELLLKKCDFDVPPSQVARAVDGFLNEYAQRAQYAGLDADYIEQHREEILKTATESATKQVRLWYIIDGIAAAEKIEAKDEEKGKKVIEFVLANAKK